MSTDGMKCSNCGGEMAPAQGGYACAYCHRASVQQPSPNAPFQPNAPGTASAPFAPPPTPSGAASHAPGTRVWSQWSGGGAGRYYTCTVLAFDGVRYQLGWDDGSAPTWEPADHVIVPMPATPSNTGPGMHVAAMWKDNRYYGGRLQSMSASGLLVAWDDGSAPTWVDGTKVFVAGPPGFVPTLAQGTHVSARWTDGRFYGGILIGFDGQRYSVAWDDGSQPTWVAARDVTIG
jgi:hypothetical protein